MHLHTDSMDRLPFKCMDGSGYAHKQQQPPSEHTATRSFRRFITDLDYSVIDALNLQSHKEIYKVGQSKH